MKIHFTSLGCAKNRIDSEQMLALLVGAGHLLVSEPEQADAAVVNTCAFIEAAQQEAIDTILSLARLKEEGSLRRLIVTGCLAERFQDEILAELPEIDAVLGTASFPDIVAALESDEPHYACFRDKNEPLPELERLVSTGPGWAYLKIADGCDNRCAYCVIPSIRGRFRSRRPQDILREAETLAAEGCREVILVAQDVTRYGRDLRDGTNLAGLLRQLCRVEGIGWVRLHYLYPAEITDELIDVMAAEEKIVKYIDMPIQHVNDRILRAMHRPETAAGIRALIAKLRAKMPECVIRTSLIVGLPGEGEEEFAELMDFLREERLERVGAFAFSPEEGTEAAGMPNRCDPEEAERRRLAVGELQAAIMDERDAAMVGRRLRVLCEGASDEEPGVWTGRSYADSPEVDEGVVFTGAAVPGEFYEVDIREACDGVLRGTIHEGI